MLSLPNRPLGYTCGVLSYNLARELLNTEVERQNNQGPTNSISTTIKKSDPLFWTDSCRYEGKNDNSKYVELFVATFQADKQAKDSFADFIPIVNNAETIDSYVNGRSLVYDSGVHYLLSNSNIIQVAGNNGNPLQLKDFSNDVYVQVLNLISDNN